MLFINVIKYTHRILFFVNIKPFTLLHKMKSMQLPLNWTICLIIMVYHSVQLLLKEKKNLNNFFFIIQMADDINHAADNNANPLKRLPVLVRILFKFFS